LLSKRFKSAQSVLEKMAVQIAEGQSISFILEQNLLLDRISIPIIRVGEECGTLGESFILISEELEKKQELQQKIITAMLYPACIFIGMIILLGVLLTVVFPKLVNVFNSLHVALPLSTRLLIFSSDFLRKWWILMLLLISALILLFTYYYRKNNVFRKHVEQGVLKIPIFGNMVQIYCLATISRILGLLLMSNTNIITALNITEESISHRLYKNALKNISEAVSQGEMIADSLEYFKSLFPEEFIHMISIGERSGKLAETYNYLQILYSRDLDMRSKALSSSIEPLLMVILGLSVGVIAISIVGPMYQITQNLHAK
jgi:type II secretory pathway component PulF